MPRWSIFERIDGQAAPVLDEVEGRPVLAQARVRRSLRAAAADELDASPLVLRLSRRSTRRSKAGLSPSGREAAEADLQPNQEWSVPGSTGDLRLANSFDALAAVVWSRLGRVVARLGRNRRMLCARLPVSVF